MEYGRYGSVFIPFLKRHCLESVNKGKMLNRCRYYSYFFLFSSSGHQLDSTAHPRHSERRTKQASQRLHEWPQHSTSAADLGVQQPASLTSSHLSSQGGEGCGGVAL